MSLVILHKLLLAAPGWVLPMLTAVASGGDDGITSGDVVEHEEHKGAPHLPSLLGFIVHHDSAAYHWVNVIYAFFVAVILSVVCMRVYAKREMIPGKLQNFVEWCVETMYNFIHTILGDDTKKYIPFLGTLFFYILALNWIGLIPGGHSPSTSINITMSMAILVFLYAQGIGVKRLGVGGYLHHMAGSPRDTVSWAMVPLIFPLHVIGELAKPVSLGLRLFGNITGEDTLIAVFVGLGIAVMAVMGLPENTPGIPFQIPFYFLGLLLSTIQALVFALLSTIYILLMLPHEEHAH